MLYSDHTVPIQTFYNLPFSNPVKHVFLFLTLIARGGLFPLQYYTPVCSTPILISSIEKSKRLKNRRFPYMKKNRIWTSPLFQTRNKSLKTIFYVGFSSFLTCFSVLRLTFFIQNWLWFYPWWLIPMVIPYGFIPDGFNLMVLTWWLIPDGYSLMVLTWWLNPYGFTYGFIPDDFNLMVLSLMILT